MEVKKLGMGFMRIVDPVNESIGILVERSEAIQLAKDLLKACGRTFAICDLEPGDILAGVPGLKTVDDIPVFSGMDLDGIQYAAGNMYDKYRLNDDKIACLVLLIANLAARVKELNLDIQSKKAIDAFKESETYRKIQEQVYGPKPTHPAEELLKAGNKGYVKIKGKRMFLISVKEYKEALTLLRNE